jgi:hypothetical protein
MHTELWCGSVLEKRDWKTKKETRESINLELGEDIVKIEDGQ